MAIAVIFAVKLLWAHKNFVETVLKLFKQCLEKLESNTGPYLMLSKPRAKCLMLMSSDILECFAR